MESFNLSQNDWDDLLKELYEDAQNNYPSIKKPDDITEEEIQAVRKKYCLACIENDHESLKRHICVEKASPSEYNAIVEELLNVRERTDFEEKDNNALNTAILTVIVLIWFLCAILLVIYLFVI
jgi:pyruvate formate-lyase activating enzyme-like uncharacterized protein